MILHGPPPDQLACWQEEERLYGAQSNPNYRPYHTCNCMNRLTPTAFGWECKGEHRDYANRPGCGAKLDHEFKRISD